MADPEPPPQLDPKVLRSMTNLIVNAVQVHRLSLEEACGRAWGYCHAYHAWLPAAVIDAAIDHCRMQLWPMRRPAVDGADRQTMRAATGGRAAVPSGRIDATRWR